MATNKKTGNWKKRTLAVRGGTMRSPFQETSEALFLTSGYAYDEAEEAEARFKGESPGYQYSRFGNPTVTMFEERMALLEGSQVGRATATGMAAVTAVFLSSLRTGDHVVAARAMFGSCLHVVEQILPRFGITYTLVDGADTAAWEEAMTPQTKLLFLETPSNPTLSLVDIAAVAKIAMEWLQDPLSCVFLVTLAVVLLQLRRRGKAPLPPGRRSARCFLTGSERAPSLRRRSRLSRCRRRSGKIRCRARRQR